MQKINVPGSYTEGGELNEKTIFLVPDSVLNKVEVGSEFIPITMEGEYLYDATQDLYCIVKEIEGNKLICTVYTRATMRY